MSLTAADRMAIHELVALHGHLMDSGELHRLDELFTPDAVYDVTALGQSVIRGIPQFREVVTSFVGDPRNPVGHHVTNVVVVGGDVDGRAAVRSKGLGVQADGSASSVTYVDQVVRTDHGWRIARRTVAP